jgi:O-antigen/teichoic acid export membrane protein
MGQFFSTALGFAVTAILGRALGAADFGILYIVGTIYSFVGVLIDWGQSTYVIREIARGHGHSDQAKFLGAALILRLIGNLCAGMAGIGIAFILGYDHFTILLVAVAAAAGFPGTLATFFGLAFRGRDRMDLDVLISLAGKSLTVPAVIVALALGGRLFSVVAVAAVGSIGSFILSIFLIDRWNIKVALPPAELVGELFKVGAPIALMSFTIGIHPLVDVALLSLLTGPTVVGWFGASQAIFVIFLTPAAILASASFPELSRAARSAPHLAEILSSATRVILAAGAFAASALFIFADFGVFLIYGHGKFDPAVVLLKVAAPILPLLFLNYLIANAVFAVGRTVAVAAAKVLCLALGALVGWFAISYFQTRYGNGAIGTFFSTGLMEILMCIAFLSLVPKGALDRRILVHLLQAYMTFAGIVLVFAALPKFSIWASVPMFGLTFTAAALATRLIVVTDVSSVIRLIKSAIATNRSQTAA